MNTLNLKVSFSLTQSLQILSCQYLNYCSSWTHFDVGCISSPPPESITTEFHISNKFFKLEKKEIRKKIALTYNVRSVS